MNVLTRFRKILWFSAKRYAVDNHSQRAVALTYYTVFAIVPMAALLFGIAKGFDLDVRLRDELSRQLYQHKEILEWVCKFADTTLKQAQGGIVAGVGVIALIWTVLWLASNIEKAFNDVWGLPTRKNIFRRFSDYLALILLTPLILVIVGASGVALRSFFNKLAAAAPDLSLLPTVFSVTADLAPLVISIAVFTLIYLLAPNTKVRFGSALLAGIIGGILFQVLQDGFIFLQANIFKYNRIYGTFAVLPLFLVWLQWSWQIALFGAEIGFVGQNIDSGIFDGKGDLRDSMRMRRVNQLACAAMIYRNFADGCGGVPLNVLAKNINLPEAMLDGQLHELIKKRIVYLMSGTAVTTFAPGFPTESFTVSDCLALLDGSDESVSGLSELPARAAEVMKTFDGRIRHNEKDPLLKDL